MLRCLAPWIPLPRSPHGSSTDWLRPKYTERTSWRSAAHGSGDCRSVGPLHSSSSSPWPPASGLLPGLPFCSSFVHSRKYFSCTLLLLKGTIHVVRHSSLQPLLELLFRVRFVIWLPRSSHASSIPQRRCFSSAHASTLNFVELRQASSLPLVGAPGPRLCPWPRR